MLHLKYKVPFCKDFTRDMNYSLCDKFKAETFKEGESCKYKRRPALTN